MVYTILSGIKGDIKTYFYILDAALCGYNFVRLMKMLYATFGNLP